MKVVLIGAGRLATCLGLSLLKTEGQVAYVYSRTDFSAAQLGKKLQCPYGSKMQQIPLLDHTLYVIAVKDDAVKQMIAQLPKLPEHSMAVHTAGSMPLSLFMGGRVGRYGVFYPMQTFSKEKLVDFSDIPCFIEANDMESLHQLNQFAHIVSHKVYELTSSERRYLHLAAVIASNFTNHCYVMAKEIADTHHIPFETLLPLIDETTQKIHRIEPKVAQTGPAVRNDNMVLTAQEALLADKPMMQAIYHLMSLSIQTINNKNTINDDKL